MAISSTDRRAKTCKFFVEKTQSKLVLKMGTTGHFSRTLAKGPKTTTWIWNLHADAHDFDSQTSSLEEVSRKIFSAHFGQQLYSYGLVVCTSMEHISLTIQLG
jgi:photosystem I P700 chlorophyll a apoprotein A1